MDDGETPINCHLDCNMMMEDLGESLLLKREPDRKMTRY